MKLKITTDEPKNLQYVNIFTMFFNGKKELFLQLFAKILGQVHTC